MKIRIFKKLQNGVFHVRIQTEDWSENDKDLMRKYGEPEINLGGTFVPNEDSSSSTYDPRVIDIPYNFVRVMSESPFTSLFDSRDEGSVENAKSVAQQWISLVEERIIAAVQELRAKDDTFTTEEITEI